MNIKIHRGTHQIGGCVTEYESNGWHLFVDYGEELAGGPKSGTLKVEGLTHGDLSKSALLITHYHGDHIGCITQLPEELPIYMSEMGREIQLVLSDHLKSVDGIQQKMFDRLQTVNAFKPGEEFTFGPFRIMPVIVDHSAFEACAFKITARRSVFHTGDFRTHGFPNIHRPDATSVSEYELQKQYEDKFREHKGNIVYLSSSNIDRLFGLYHAALRADRPFIVDTYQKRMMDVVTKRDHIWGKSKLYQYDKKYPPMELQYENNEFRMNEKFRYLLEQKGYVLIARANERFDNFIDRLPGEKHKYLSMWKGYVDESCEAYNERLAKSLGGNYEYMHTSGHCDMDRLGKVFELLNPKAVIPIHTDNPEVFATTFGNRWQIIRLCDGESFCPA